VTPKNATNAVTQNSRLGKPRVAFGNRVGPFAGLVARPAASDTVIPLRRPGGVSINY